ncbi:MAG: rubrerythrin family protein [Planctomycetaceae bacterium]|nr:rubrerythrin family protein [Planctomycetaceae bacterium]
MDLKGTQTERNLLMAFAGESQARNRYTFFSSQARNEGYIQIALIFEETANQEKEHAKRFFKYLQGGEVKIECAFPAGVIGTTAENLAAAASGEHDEWSNAYPAFAAVAKQEGFSAISVVFEKISVAEKQHDRRFRGLLESLQAGRTFKRQQPVKWRCLNCGYVHEGPEAPAACPACAHPQAYFELLAENW